MASILTNYSAMTALQTLRGVNNNLGETQSRISTGLKVRSGKDNAAYFNISSTMRGDSGMYKSINEGLSLTKNSIATARAGAEQFVNIATEFVERVAFAQGESLDHEDVIKELNELVGRMETVVSQSTFNGDNLVDTPVVDGDDNAVDPRTRTVVTGVTRAGGSFDVTTITFNEVALGDIAAQFKAAVEGVSRTDETTPVAEADLYDPEVGDPDQPDGDATATPPVPPYEPGGFKAEVGLANLKDLEELHDGTNFGGKELSTLKHELLGKVLKDVEGQLKRAVDAATSLGIAEKSIEVQQDFLSTLTDGIDGGIGGMIDANMEEEASRLQALQVQQQLATQSLSIANQNPQNILALFR